MHCRWFKFGLVAGLSILVGSPPSTGDGPGAPGGRGPEPAAHQGSDVPSYAFDDGLYELRVNAGGGAHTDAYGYAFAADQPYVAGQFGYVGGIVGQSTMPVADTTDDALYQIQRGGPSFSYVFDGLPAATYEVRLHFNEAWQTEAGLRMFRVTAEGQIALDMYDAFFHCGSPSSRFRPDVGNHRACSQNFDVVVNDGQLNLDWDVQVGLNAFVAAIVVRQKRKLTVSIAAYDEVSAAVGITHHNTFDPGQCLQSIGTGSAWADYNGDELLDLYVTNHGGPNRLYRNNGDTNGDGLPDFTDVAAVAGVADASGYSHGAVFIDYDNDVDQELYVP